MQAVLLGVSFALLSVIWWPTPYALAADAKVARGAVVAIGSNSLTVKVRDQDMKFSIDRTTVVQARGAGTKARAAQATGSPGPKLTDVLRVGQGVAVTYHEVDGVLHASVVRAVASVSGTQSDEAPTEPPAMSSTGTVQAIGGNSITVAGASGGGATFTQTFIIDQNTKVFAKGAGTAAAAKGVRVPFSEIVSSGDHVSVSYRKMGDRLLATDVRVTTKAMH